MTKLNSRRKIVMFMMFQTVMYSVAGSKIIFSETTKLTKWKIVMKLISRRMTAMTLTQNSRAESQVKGTT